VHTVRQWLDQLGLSQYAEVFERNAVDLDVLCELTDEDLEKVGVLALGHRKKLLKAIADLRGAGNASNQQAGQANPPSEPALGTGAERRQLTVLFCDLAGSTELAMKLDPEELRTLLQSYQRACGEVVARYDGHVAQYLGDGLMVYFGWPTAHEDDAARAIRAGLEAVEAVSRLAAPAPLRARGGIHTGLVVIGESGQGDPSIPRAAVGDTPNVAARLQALATPGSVVVSERTASLARGLFQYTDLGARTIKGVDEPVRLFRVDARRAIESRFEARHGEAALTPLVGREEEIALLLRRWEEAKEAEGQVVLVGGEAGIGKSRLTGALRERLAQDRYALLRYQCSPYHVSSALYPVIEQFERVAGFAHEDTPGHKLDKMQAALAGSEAAVTESAPLFAAMLSLPADRYPPLDLSPHRQKEKTLEALVHRIEAMARQQPLLMLWEDAHWIDATSQEFLDLLVPRLRGLPVLMVVTHRPEYALRWTDQVHVTTLGLNRLARRQGTELVARLTGGKPIPREVLDQILVRTDGVPLFIEELVKSVLESSMLRDIRDRYLLDARSPALVIPSTLRDSLIARLDRLAEVREIAQIGACIGREFSYSLLALVAPVQGERLDSALEQLTKTGMVFKRGTAAAASYTFKHALVRDAAYDSLLKSRRQELHAAIAHALEERFPETHETEPAVLGLHYERADLPEPATAWYVRAGKQAQARSAYREAIHGFERALAVVARSQPMPNGRSLEITLRSDLGMLYLMLEGFGSAQARGHLTRARELGVQASHEERFPALVGLVEILSWDADKEEARAVGEVLLQLAAASGERVHSLFAHQARGRSNMYMGRFREALIESQRALEIYDERTDRLLAFRYGYDPGVIALSSIAYSHLTLGYPDQAARCAEECITLARRIGQPYTLSFALTLAGADFCYLVRDAQGALRFGHEGQELSAKWGFGYLEAMCTVHAGWATAMQGRHAEGLESMSRALEAIRNMRVWSVTPRMIAQLASVYAHAGRADEALSVLASSPDRQGGRLRVRAAEIRRIEGDLNRLRSRPDLEAAEACYREAIEIAIEDEARGSHLRAATSLARLWLEQGKSGPAHRLLAPLFASFTEGHGFTDLREAKKVLDELGAHPME
jgi:class 3 adenylate cyclase/tetratricopeptide (TPR) repeat protein